MDNKTMIEKMRGTRIPDYYDGMYKDNYQPWEIVEAAKKSIIKEAEARKAEREAAAETPDAPMNVHFQVEVKK